MDEWLTDQSPCDMFLDLAHMILPPRKSENRNRGTGVPSAGPTRHLEIVPGGLIRQPPPRDPGTIDWDSQPKSTISVRIVNFEQFRSITGREPPMPPPTPQSTQVSPRGERNQGGTDGIVISNAEYDSRHLRG